MQDAKIRPVKWTSPSGKEFILKLSEAVKTSRKRQGEMKNNPSRSYGEKNSRTSYKTINTSEDTFRETGISGRDIPLEIIFAGDNHASKALEFEKYYCEKGRSKLQLQYGNIIPVQAMDIDTSYDPVKSANITYVSVTFHECGTTRYPVSEKSKKSSTKARAQEIKQTAAQSYSSAIESSTDKLGFAASFKAGLEKIEKVFSNIQDSKYLAVLEDLKNQNILSNSFVMSSQIGILLNAAFSTYTTAAGVFDSLSDLMDGFFASGIEQNTYKTENFIAQNAIISIGEVLNDMEFETKKDAVNAAEKLQNANDEYIEKSQESEKNLNNSLIDTITDNTDTSEVVNKVIDALVDKADNLKVEKIVNIHTITPLVNIAYKHYPEMFLSDPDGAIDYLIKTNVLEGDKIIFLEKGDKIKIYV